MALPALETLLNLPPIKLYELLRDNAPPRDEREALFHMMILVLAKKQERADLQAAASAEAMQLLIDGVNKLRELIVGATSGAAAGGDAGPVDAESANAHIADLSAEMLQQQQRPPQNPVKDATPFPSGVSTAPRGDVPPGTTIVSGVAAQAAPQGGGGAPVNVGGEAVTPNQSVSVPSRVTPISPNVMAKK